MSYVFTSTFAPPRAFRIRQIALPTEHGGWGFLFEPMLAASAIAFSPAGIWISLAMIGAFLARQPLKILIADRIGTRLPGRGAAAFVFVALFGAIFVMGLAGAITFGGARPLVPFLIVLPLVPFQVYSDVKRRSRRLLPELTGAFSISASAAAIALAGGFDWSIAITLWAVFLCRLVPSIIYVRERLRLEKGKGCSRALPTIAHIAALFTVILLAYAGLSPYLPIAAMLLLLYRGVEGLSERRKRLKAINVGVREVIYGAVTVATVVVGHYAGL